MAIDKTKIDQEIDPKTNLVAELFEVMRMAKKYHNDGKVIRKDLPDFVKRFYEIMEIVLTDIEKYKVK